MSGTKEGILLAALHLFAQKGYEAVSVSEITGELGMTKGALYKHFKSKRDIFESIVSRMERLDAERARRFKLPEGALGDIGEAYRKTSMGHLVEFSRAQFCYWTQEDFPASFRRMLTLEQYRSEEMRVLYEQYLVSGPLGYVADLFGAWNIEDAQKKAVEFYAPMFLFYSIYDGAADKAAALRAIKEQIDYFCDRWAARERL